jgi:two-component system chemotaxis response regulator CheY
MRLLIVDDSQFMRKIIEESFHTFPINTISSASNGAEALDLYCKSRYDLVTMDLTMPEMGGLECIRKLKQYDPEAVIFVVTSLADKATGLKALSLGAMKFFLKPINAKKLEQAMIKFFSLTNLKA